MKELSIEEKAKAYDEALEKARQLCAYPTTKLFISDLQDIFPELKESDDERIRKNIIATIHLYYGEPLDDEAKEMIAWLEKKGEPKEINPSEFDLRLNILLKHFEPLPKEEIASSLSFYLNVVQNNGTYKEEKQGEQKSNPCENCSIATNNCQNFPCTIRDCEQKPVDKVEPKFKVGDIITNGKIIGKVDENENNKYHGWFGYDKDLSVHYADIPDVENWHLWTIQDAKAGDVLVDGNLPFIFKKIDTNKYSYAYCGISVYDGFKIETNGIYGEWTWTQDIKPATKEQCNTLMKAMTDAGYTFDFEKKELKKIEQKPAWSEEDEYCINQLIVFCENCMVQDDGAKRCAHWLKSLKDRVQPQPKQEWSEEDEKVLDNIFYILNQLKDTTPYKEDKTAKECIDKLKSLKERYAFKPSKEQMEALEHFIVYHNGSTNYAKDLEELRLQLKKLREEDV